MKKVIIGLFILLIPFSIKAETKAVIDINELTMSEIQSEVKKGHITYETIMNIYLERIEAYNKQYNAYITVSKSALEEAKKCDIEKKYTSLVYCLPIVVKDNIDVKGMPTTAGAKGLADNYPKENAPIIQKLVDAGAIIIGKANMSEFAFHATDSYSSYGHTYNAYNTLYSSYGSSGGVAVSVAANLAVAGIGTDTGSSIRIPSAANNLVGLRPTVGIINMDGIIKFEDTRDVAGPITKYVEDNAIMLEIIDNEDIKYQDELKKASLEGIRIGVLRTYMNPNTTNTSIAGGITDRSVYNLMQKAIQNLKDLGAEIVDLGALALPYRFDAHTMCGNFNNYLKGTEGTIRSYGDLLNSGKFVSDLWSYNTYCITDYHKTSAYKSYLAYRKNNINTANNFFKSKKVDALIYPTLKTSLLKISEIYTRKLYTPSSNIAPLVGFPSMNVQIGYIDSLPYGMEILSQANKEALIYKIAYNYQTINNYYKTPSIAPSLYEIPENIDTVLNYLKENKTNIHYQTFYQKAKDFVNNYNSIENVESKINGLIQEYENIPNLIKEDEEKARIQKRNKYIVIITGSVVTLASIIIIGMKLKHKNKNVRRKRYGKIKKSH